MKTRGYLLIVAVIPALQSCQPHADQAVLQLAGAGQQLSQLTGQYFEVTQKILTVSCQLASLRDALDGAARVNCSAEEQQTARLLAHYQGMASSMNNAYAALAKWAQPATTNGVDAASQAPLQGAWPELAQNLGARQLQHTAATAVASFASTLSQLDALDQIYYSYAQRRALLVEALSRSDLLAPTPPAVVDTGQALGLMLIHENSVAGQRLSLTYKAASYAGALAAVPQSRLSLALALQELATATGALGQQAPPLPHMDQARSDLDTLKTRFRLACLNNLERDHATRESGDICAIGGG